VALTALVDAMALAGSVRRSGGRVVLTNGCFDVLHRGHVDYLTAARALGDLLVVGLNTDSGVRWLKGAGRPVNPAADRACVLAALRCVDAVVAFDEPTAAELCAAVRPDVYVKGGDYTEDRLPEAEVVRGYGGEVRILAVTPGHSTTATLAALSVPAAPPSLRRADG
jgi:rfaE bifunctional protein nucleotidyltransferase chain/domain